MQFTAVIPFLLIFSSACATAQENPYVCNKATHELRAGEIQAIVKADQAERSENLITPETVARDKVRRMRIGEIFGEGCFLTAADFSAAALVYQHGNVPEHFFQTFIWSKRAVELGDSSQQRMMALGLDRYLVNTGRKQLFASQASKPDEKSCWCLEQIEKSFPDAKRKAQTGKNLNEAFQWVDELNKNTSCPAAQECSKPLSKTPQGSIPGVW